MNIEITDIQRIVVHPGEMLLVRVPAAASHADGLRVLDTFKQVLPGVPICVVQDTVEVSVVSEEDVPA